MYAVYIKNDIKISSSPVSIKIHSIPVQELNILSLYMIDPHSALCVVDPPVAPIFANKYSVIFDSAEFNKSIFVDCSTNSFIVPIIRCNELTYRSLDSQAGKIPIKIAPVFNINNNDFIGIYSMKLIEDTFGMHHHHHHELHRRDPYHSPYLPSPYPPPYIPPHYLQHPYQQPSFESGTYHTVSHARQHTESDVKQRSDRPSVCADLRPDHSRKRRQVDRPMVGTEHRDSDHETDISFTWKSIKDSSDLVVMVSGNSLEHPETVYVNVESIVKSTTFGGFVVYRNLRPGNHTIGVAYEHQNGTMSYQITKNCTIIYNIETSG